jgi:hypothetical protein
LIAGSAIFRSCLARTSAPIAENVQVKAFTAMNGADLAGVGGTASLGQDARLALDGEDPAAEAAGNLRQTAAGADTIINRRPP